MKRISVYLPTILTLGVTAHLALLGINSIGSNETSIKLLNYDATNMTAWVLLINFILHWRFSANLGMRTRIAFLSISAISILVSTVLSIIDWLTPENTVFAATKLRQEELGLLSIFAGTTALINAPKNWVRKNSSAILTALPIVGFLLLFLIRIWPFNYFLEIVKEDRIIENSQAIILLLGGVLLGLLAVKFLKAKKYAEVTIFGVIAVGYFVFGMEEISWGQRIFGIETPQAYAEINLQGETTLHNLPSIQRYMNLAYFMISVVAIFGRVILSSIHRIISAPILVRTQSIFPDERFVFYFLPTLFFQHANMVISWGVWHEWAEPMELFIYSGVVIWTILLAMQKLRLRYFESRA